ncbi:MAG: phenylacetate-CoA oxygenase subunit PaaJ [Saprospiraceae bacterium]|nr:phenylacetate-CoA oxygenase subunit PaaJ [Saprospiraceae bacterium]
MNIEIIKNILEHVTDPEIPVISISELGILRDVIYDIKNEKIIVQITPTYTGCPAMDMITVNIKSALQEHGYNNVEVISLLEPTWTTDWITDEGRKKLMEYGITPPVEKTSDHSFITGIRPKVQCPICNSYHTEMISRFGSTPCKSLYKCLDCLEPFDYFKCH